MAVASGLDSVHIGNFVAMNGDCFWGNGFDPVKVWDGFGSIRDVGLPSYDSTPSAADGAAGSVTAGVHLVRCRYMRGTAEYVGDAGTAYSHTAAGSKKLTVTTVATTAAGVDSIVIELTTAGGTTYYEGGRFPNTTGSKTVDRSDITLAENPLGWDNLGHTAPPVGSVLVEHKGCLLVGVPAVHARGTVAVSGTYVNGTNTYFKAAVADDWWFLASGDTAASRVETFTSASRIVLESTHAAKAAGCTYKLWSPRANKIYASKPLLPESFGDTSGAYREQEVLQGRGDTLKSFISWNGYVVVFGEHSMEKWTWTEDITDGQIIPIAGERGACGSKVVKNIEGILYAWDKDGFFRWAGGVPESISGPVDELLPIVNWAAAANFHCCWNPEKRMLMWFAATGSETDPRSAFCYNVDDQSWHLRGYDYAWTAAGVAPDSNGFLRPLFFDKNGFSWFDGLGWRDGTHPTCTVAMTCDSGSTATNVKLISTNTIYHLGGSGMAGAPCYWVEGAEVFFPTSNHATSKWLYPSAALAAAPSAGDTIYCGRVNFTYRTKEFNVSGTDNEQKGLYFCLDFIPTPQAQYMTIRIYENMSVSPRNDWVTNTSGQEGVSFTAGSTDVTVDLSTASGHVKIPLSDVWGKHISFEMSIASPDVRLQGLGYYLLIEGEREAVP